MSIERGRKRLGDRCGKRLGSSFNDGAIVAPLLVVVGTTV